MGVHIETTRPSKIMLLISLAIVVLAVVGHYYRIPYVTQYQFWVLLAGYVVLLFGSLFGR
jgi:hypothetical protein